MLYIIHRYLRIPALIILLYLFPTACTPKASGKRVATASPRLLSAEQERWSAGHRSGGQGVNFYFTLLSADADIQWREFESAGRTFALSIESSGPADTLRLQATWLSAIDSAYAEEGVPDFQQGLLLYEDAGGRHSISVPQLSKRESRPRP